MSARPPSNTIPPRTLGLLTAIWLILSLNLVLTVALFQTNVLVWDQWDFYRPLFEGGRLWDLFNLQHGPHRQGLGFVFTSWILDATSWDTRADSLWIAALLSVSAPLALRLKWKLTGTLDAIDAWIPLVVLSLGQFEALIGTPNASHSAFPLALLLLVANGWLSVRPAARYLAGGVGALCLTFTGFGIFAGVMLTVLLVSSAIRHAIAREWAAGGSAIVGLLIATAGWLLFSRGYVFAPAVPNFRFPWEPATDYVRFVLLMLVHPAGVSGESTPHYVAGTVLAVSGLLAGCYSLFVWLHTKRGALDRDVLVLLIGSGILFVLNTAVGRVSLGIAGGMASRYLTLLFPLWLGIYLASLQSHKRWATLATTVLLWALALWPWREMARRPLRDWAGTLGATHGQHADIERRWFNKASWVDTYMKTESWQKAQVSNGDAVYPAPEATRMDQKLQFLRDRKLSFFKTAEPTEAFLPWLPTHRVIWNNEFPTTRTPHTLNAVDRLAFASNRAGYLHLALSTDRPHLTGGLQLRIEHEGRESRIRLSSLPSVIAVPAIVGFTRVLIDRSENLDESLVISVTAQFQTERSPQSILVP